MSGPTVDAKSSLPELERADFDSLEFLLQTATPATASLAYVPSGGIWDEPGDPDFVIERGEWRLFGEIKIVTGAGVEAFLYNTAREMGPTIDHGRFDALLIIGIDLNADSGSFVSSFDDGDLQVGFAVVANDMGPTSWRALKSALQSVGI